jgi:branched-chain amino acid transport system substrate-binding protein
MQFRLPRIGAALVAAALLLVSAPVVRAAEPIEIPVVFPLTGGFAYAGSLGKTTLQAMEATINKEGGIHGTPIKFVFYDDAGVPQTAVQVTQQALASSKSPVLVGSMFVALCQAMAPLTAGKAIQYCISPGVHPHYGEDLFSASIATDGMATAMLRYMRLKGLKRVATITSTDASGQDAENQLKATALVPEKVNGGLTIVDAEHFNPADQSVLAQMQRIAASKPDVVVAWTSGAPFGTVVHAYNDARLNVPVFTTNANMSFTFMKQFADILPKDLYFPGPAFLAGPDAPWLSKPMRAAIKKLYDTAKTANFPVDFQSGNSWDPPMILIDALRHLPANPSAAQVKAWILAQKNWVGVSGVYDFTDAGGVQRGLTVKDTLILRWDVNKQLFVPVSKFAGNL